MIDSLDAEQIKAIVRAEMERHGPLDPIYTFAVAIAAVPCGPHSMRKWLKVGGFQARYSWLGPVRTRMVLASEVRWVRDKMMRPTRRVAGRGE